MDNDQLLHQPSRVPTGIVYIVSNPAMPGYIKIGRTADLIHRINQLNSSSVPLPFVCEYAGLVSHPQRVEHTLHVLFGKFRTSADREFFTVEVDIAIDAFKLMQHEDVTESAYPIGFVRRERKPTTVVKAFRDVHLSPLTTMNHAEMVEHVLKSQGGQVASQKILAELLNVSHGHMSKMLRNCPNVDRVWDDSTKCNVIRLRG